MFNISIKMLKLLSHVNANEHSRLAKDVENDIDGSE